MHEFLLFVLQSEFGRQACRRQLDVVRRRRPVQAKDAAQRELLSATSAAEIAHQRVQHLDVNRSVFFWSLLFRPKPNLHSSSRAMWLLTLGKGGYGEVYLAKWKVNNEIVCLKRMAKSETIMKNEVCSALPALPSKDSLFSSREFCKYLRENADCKCET